MRRFFVCCLLLVWSCVLAAGQMTTQHNDNSRTGQNLAEKILTPANVNPNQFGLQRAVHVDGYMSAQPLYLPSVSLPDGTVRSLIFVATMHDSVYAISAVNGGVVWKTNLIPPGAGTEPISAEGCAETGFVENGILGTPVIDASTNTLFVVAKTKESGQPVFRIHALDIGTGIETMPSVVLAGSVTTMTGSTTFHAGTLHQRPALLLSNHTVYVAVGSNGCDLHAIGWVMAYDENTLQQTAIFGNDADQPFGGSIWQSGKGLAADADGNVFFATANGMLNDSTGDYGDSVVRLSGTLSLSDYFAPYVQSTLESDDLDLGAGGVILLPDQTSQPKHLLVAAGKEGTVYLLDRDNLGQYDPDHDHAVQTIPGGLPQVGGGGTGAAFWNNRIYYATTSGMRVFALGSGSLTPVTIPRGTSSISGKGLPSISANGTSNGIVWMLRGLNYSSPILTAYNATTMSMLYDSTMAANGRDTVGPIAHFATPTIAAGRVYVGTQSQLLIYGQLSGKLSVVAGNGQTGSRGKTLSQPLQVMAVSASGAAIPNMAVTFTDNGAGGNFSYPSTTTNSSGVAVTQYTLPYKPGTVSITVSATGLTPIQFSETAQ